MRFNDNEHDDVIEIADAHRRNLMTATESHSLAAALGRLESGAVCEECRWQRGELVTRRRVLCKRCAQVDRACRRVDAAARMLRRQQARGKGGTR